VTTWEALGIAWRVHLEQRHGKDRVASGIGTSEMKRDCVGANAMLNREGTQPQLLEFGGSLDGEVLGQQINRITDHNRRRGMGSVPSLLGVFKGFINAFLSTSTCFLKHVGVRGSRGIHAKLRLSCTQEQVRGTRGPSFLQRKGGRSVVEWGALL
jgi:hypothetical protein